MALLAVSLAIVLCERPTSKGVHAESTNKMFGVPFLVESIDNTPCDCLATSSTQASGLLVVMNLTVWFPSMLVKRTTSKGLLAVLAHEVLWVPLLTQGIDAFPADGLVARATSRSKGTIEAVLAVGPRILFKERAPFEGAEALRADEVIDVPLFVESCHAAVQDRLVTVCATSAKTAPGNTSRSAGGHLVRRNCWCPGGSDSSRTQNAPGGMCCQVLGLLHQG